MRRRLLPVLAAAACLVASCSADETSPTTTLATTTTVDASAAPAGGVASSEPVPSAGCGASSATAVDLERRTLGGSDRWYLLTIPTAHDGTTPLPVVLDFHGLAEGAEVHTRTSQLGPYAAQHGFVAVFPNGTGTPVRWSGETDRAANADLVFVDQLLDALETDLCLDTSRIYATGFSDGAILSSVIACTMADRFAAVAPVAGVTAPEQCDPSRPVPALAFHGTVDPILLFNGGVGGRLASVLGGGGAEEAPLAEADLGGEGYPANAATWAARNGCTDEPVESDLTPSVIERTWDCPAGAAVVFEIMVDAGHSWPGSEFTKSIEQILGPTDMSIDGTDMIWRFFRRFALPAA